MRRTQRISISFGSFLAATIIACNGDSEVSEPTQPPPPPPPVVSLAIIPSSLELRLGDEAILIHKALDSANRVVVTVAEWTSDNQAVATIGRTDGRLTAVGAGTAVITAAAAGLRATATITVVKPVPATMRLSTNEVVLALGSSERVTALVFDQNGRQFNADISWVSENPAIATVSSDGTVTGTGTGATVVNATVEAVSAQFAVRVELATFMMQWASSASASTQYENDMWSAAQAVGKPNVTSCNNEWQAWASAEANGQDWLELKYDQPVRPTEIQIYEAWAPGSIVKVEVKGASNIYHEVYSTSPKSVGSCVLRTLTIAVTGVTELISTVRITLDQRQIGDWNEIDAVRLTGYRQP